MVHGSTYNPHVSVPFSKDNIHAATYISYVYYS